PLSCASLLLHAVNGTPKGGVDTYAADDPLPPVIEVSGIPSFAFDQYTRLGKAAIRQYVSRSERWRAFSEPLKLTRQQQATAAGELFFRVESAVVRRRRSWDIGRVLRDQALP